MAVDVYTGVYGAFPARHPHHVLMDAFRHVAFSGPYNNGLRWIMSPRTFMLIMQIHDADGNCVFWPNLCLPPPSTLMGLPVEVTEYIEDFATGASAIKIMHGDEVLVRVVFDLSKTKGD